MCHYYCKILKRIDIKQKVSSRLGYFTKTAKTTKKPKKRSANFDTFDNWPFWQLSTFQTYVTYASQYLKCTETNFFQCIWFTFFTLSMYMIYLFGRMKVKVGQKNISSYFMSCCTNRIVLFYIFFPLKSTKPKPERKRGLVFLLFKYFGIICSWFFLFKMWF